VTSGIVMGFLSTRLSRCGIVSKRTYTPSDVFSRLVRPAF